MKKPFILIITTVVIFCTAMLWLSAQHDAQPKPVGNVVTVAVEGVKNQAAFDALAVNLAKTAGISEITTNVKTGFMTARIDESKVTLGGFVNMVAKSPLPENAEKFYGAKIVCYLNSKDEEKAAKLSDATKALIIDTMKKRPGITDMTLSDDGRVGKISIAPTAKMLIGNIGSWIGHGLRSSGMMVSLSGPVTSLVPNDNKTCNQCHAHMPK